MAARPTIAVSCKMTIERVVRMMFSIPVRILNCHSIAVALLAWTTSYSLPSFQGSALGRTAKELPVFGTNLRYLFVLLEIHPGR